VREQAGLRSPACGAKARDPPRGGPRWEGRDPFPARTIGRPGFSRKVRAGAHPSGPERSRTMGDQDEARGNSGGGPKRY
jgi:hypothetical protein